MDLAAFANFNLRNISLKKALMNNNIERLSPFMS